MNVRAVFLPLLGLFDVMIMLIHKKACFFGAALHIFGLGISSVELTMSISEYKFETSENLDFVHMVWTMGSLKPTLRFHAGGVFNSEGVGTRHLSSIRVAHKSVKSRSQLTKIISARCRSSIRQSHVLRW